jgi:hypothetical protein
VNVDFHATKSGEWSGAEDGAQYPDALPARAALAASMTRGLPPLSGLHMGAATSAQTAALLGSGLAGRPIEITVVSTLDGREVARNQTRHIPTVLQGLGIRSR